MNSENICKFKIGDTVRVLEDNTGSPDKPFLGKVGTVVYDINWDLIGVDFGEGIYGSWCLKDNILEKPTGREFRYKDVEKCNGYEVNLL